MVLPRRRPLRRHARRRLSAAAGLAGYLTRADPGLRRHGVIHDGQLAGVVAVRSPWLRGAYLELLGMTAEQQRQGLGQAVIGWLTAEAARNGANLWVTVSAFNEPARRFYARQGFVPVGDLPDLVRAGSTEILLRLPPPADRR